MLKQGPTFLQYADHSVRDNAEFMMRPVTKDGMFLKYATNPVRRNHRIALRAIESDVEAIRYVLADKLRRSQNFLLEAVARNPEIYREVVQRYDHESNNASREAGAT